MFSTIFDAVRLSRNTAFIVELMNLYLRRIEFLVFHSMHMIPEQNQDRKLNPDADCKMRLE